VSARLNKDGKRVSDTRSLSQACYVRVYVYMCAYMRCNVRCSSVRSPSAPCRVILRSFVDLLLLPVHLRADDTYTDFINAGDDRLRRNCAPYARLLHS